MSVLLKVNYVPQLHYGPQNKMNDPTGCWYASACMVAYFFEAGPRLGVPEIHARRLTATQMHMMKKIFQSHGVAMNATDGHYATGSAEANIALALQGQKRDEHDLLARRERLEAVPGCDGKGTYTLANLENFLRYRGPVFFYWWKPYGHASVAIGTDDKTKQVIYHDPESGASMRMSMAAFNQVRQKWKYALMWRRGKKDPEYIKTKIVK